MTAMTHNLTVASSRLDDVGRASNRLIDALGRGELSGKGYSAVQALFAHLVAPCVARAKQEIHGLRATLERYSFEDSKISRYRVLSEDELTAQLAATIRHRDATERLIETNTAAANSLATVPGIGETLEAKNRQLEMVLGQLQADVRSLEERLTVLQAFSSATRGLFHDGLAKLEHAIADTVALLNRLAGAGGGGSAARKQLVTFLAGLGSETDWSTATPAELSSLLTSLSPAQMKTMLAAHPELLQRFWDHPPAPENTAAWWKTLDAAQRKEWAKAIPRLVGNLDGVPPRVRSDANRVCLLADLADAKKRLKDAKADPGLVSPVDGIRQQALNRLAVAQKLADTLSRIDIAYGGGPSGNPPHELYVFKPGERIKVAISTGLLETAEHISLLIPGMGTTANDIGQYTNAAKDMQQQQWLASGVPRDKIAVLAWLDYDPPGGMNALGVKHDDLAKAGAERLGNALRGLTAVKEWPANAAGLSVVAHSYGTNVATLALARKGVTAGHVVLLGSAGIASSVPTAAALHVPSGEVYAAQGIWDGWAVIGQGWSGRQDPTRPGFGAHTFTADATTLDGTDLKGITQHGPLANSKERPDSYSYLDNRTTAQYATAMATMGRGQEIPVGGTPQDRARAFPTPPLPAPPPSKPGR
ncbi:alpha/beta hydrolase [Leifsonia sp. NPDC077715]|uniref:alpha/beta hydrolase n=1 Tax=Leifsonia sp. NPDC077715 TaxID=3155539 RepID=UPI00342172C8